MSFNKLFVPDLDKLQEFLQQKGSVAFYSRFIRKTDAFIGPSDAVEFLNKFTEKYDKEDIEFFEI